MTETHNPNDYAEGFTPAVPGGVQGAGFSASEIDSHVNDGNITQPDDSVQTETGYFPANINPSIEAMYHSGE